jgi:hypothetical protein
VRRWSGLLLRSRLARSVIRLRRRARAIVGRRMRYLRVVVRRNVVGGASLLITVLRRRLRNISILRGARLRAIVLLRSRSIITVGLRRIIGLSRPVHSR